jgi:hypothetical protein
MAVLLLLSPLMDTGSLLWGQEENASGGGRWQARSMVETKFGIVATSQTLASAAGAHILEIGGNAIDAAIAANAVLGVVEPMSNGIGCDLFAIVYEARTGKTLRTERQRLGAYRTDNRSGRAAKHQENATEGDLLGDCSRRSRGLGSVTDAVRYDAVRANSRPRHLLPRTDFQSLK